MPLVVTPPSFGYKFVTGNGVSDQKEIQYENIYGN